MKKIIAATGLDGLVGSRIQNLLSNDFEFISLNEKTMDITNGEAVAETISKTEFDLFLHLAAFTNVDAADKSRKLAWNVNVVGTENVLNTVKKKNKEFIYISTGFVFDGNNPPYFEDSKPHPISYYGETKYEGEQLVKGKGAIVRIDYPYGGHVEYKKDLVETFIELLNNKTPISGITDQILTPTFIDDIAYALKGLINDYKPDTYHFVGSDSLSGYEIIKTIGDVFDIDTSHVEQITYDKFYGNKAKRPRNSIMKSKMNSFHTMNNFKDGLERLKTLRYHKEL